jgi:putative membrane protein
MSVSDLPAFNASLNLTAAILIGTGIFFIKRKNVRAHKVCMIAALAVSTVFLASYLFYHYNVGTVHFTKTGWIRNFYFPLLITHTILAVVIVPMVLRTAFLGLSDRFSGHVRIARWTFPTWMYVSITGVVVYIMLYRL